jgi:pimeloyl-ACP methyl ester carboxylesterase
MKLIVLIMMVGLVFLGGLFFFSRKLLYFPAPVSNGRLEYLRTEFEQVEEISIPVEKKIILHGWVLKKDMVRLPTIFYFGGNAEEVSLNLEDYIKKLDANVVMVNYRGYGRSTGSPTEEKLKSDVLVVYDTMVETLGLNPNNTIAWGRSLGSSMAAYLALERGLGKLILTCPFDSIEAVAGNYYPPWLVRMVLKDRHLTIDFSSRIKTPALVLASRKDEVIAPKNTRKLYESLTCPKRMVYIDGAGHNTISEFESYYKEINLFMDQANQLKGES